MSITINSLILSLAQTSLLYYSRVLVDKLRTRHTKKQERYNYVVKPRHQFTAILCNINVVSILSQRTYGKTIPTRYSLDGKLGGRNPL